jgi:predicted TIM-barrel fold metal-dependent hydrolase
MRLWVRAALAAALLALAAVPAAAAPRFAVIDMHFHAERPDAEGPPGGKVCAPYQRWSPRDPGKPIDAYLDWFTVHPTCPHYLVAPTDPVVLRDRGLAMLSRYNILALAGGDAATVEDFRSHAPDRVMPSAGFGQANDFPSISALRQLHAEGKLKAISEITAQYAGIAPDDPRLEPYYALAEELDIPVGIHLGPGPPGTAYFATPDYRAAAGDPFRLEPVLIRHPHLRLYAMHAGWPMGEAMIAMLYAHPQLYVDIGILDYAYPKKDFYAYLKRLIDAGFEERIMFGSDNMVWPDAIGVAIERVRAAPFLSARQKRLILHDNAARFLRIEG